MRVTCLTNSGANLPDYYRKYGSYDTYRFPVKEGNSYTVYGMILWKRLINYLIFGDDEQFPAWIPAALFEITDGKLSRHWYCSSNIDGLDNTVDFVWGYKELATCFPHFDSLEERNEDALEVFKSRKMAMDLEFADPAVSDTAEILEDDWILCPNCVDAWESQPSLDVLVKCPNCGSVLVNPKQIEPTK